MDVEVDVDVDVVCPPVPGPSTGTLSFLLLPQQASSLGDLKQDRPAVPEFLRSET